MDSACKLPVGDLCTKGKSFHIVPHHSHTLCTLHQAKFNLSFRSQLTWNFLRKDVPAKFGPMYPLYISSVVLTTIIIKSFLV